MPDGSKRQAYLRLGKDNLCAAVEPKKFRLLSYGTEADRLSFMRLCYKLGVAAVVLLLPCIPAYPAELAILRNGFAIRYERREARNTMTRLYLTGTSNDYVDVPTGEIVRFQEEDLDLPEIPVPSLAPADTLDEVISAASTRNKVVCKPAKRHVGRWSRDGSPHP